VLPGIRNLLADLRAQQIPIGLASVSLNAPTILAALELREFFTFCADASQLKNSKPDPEIFLAACAGLGVPPQACIGIEDAQAGIDAINASGMRSVGIGAGLTGAQLLLPSTDSLTWAAVIGLLAKRIAKESTWLSFRYNIFKKSTITRCMW